MTLNSNQLLVQLSITFACESPKYNHIMAENIDNAAMVILDTASMTTVAGLDSSFVQPVATRFGLDGPGIEYRWGRDIPNPSRPVLGSTQPPIQWVPSLSPGVQRPARGVDHPPASIAEVKERVELYFCSTSGPSWSVLGWSLPLPLTLWHCGNSRKRWQDNTKMEVKGRRCEGLIFTQLSTFMAYWQIFFFFNF